MLRKHSVLIAKILIFISFILLIWSVIIYNQENEALINPKNSTSLYPQDAEVNVTTKDEINSQENTQNSSENNLPTENTTDNSNNATDNGLAPSNPNDNVVIPNNTQVSPNTTPQQNTPTPEASRQSAIIEINNNLRNTIKNNFGINIYYGNETANYNVGGLSTYVETNEYTINSALNALSTTIAYYPYGFFQEISNGGIPLSIYLIKNYSQSGVTGATNTFNNKAVISLSLQYDLIESFNHEVFHYIEKYIKKRGDNFNNWNTLNPYGFKYNSINGNLSYNRTFAANAPFVNNYAQTSADEDRASTFEYMMAATKASCLNRDTTIWRKADYLAQKIDLTFDTVRPDTIEYWERFIY